MEALAIDRTSTSPVRIDCAPPHVKVKLSLMRQISAELKKRYGTQQVAADAMEVTQSDISELYNDRHSGFSIVFLIQLAAKLDKVVTVTVT